MSHPPASPTPATQIALYRPEIPQNTGNIGRLSWCTGSRLHIIGQPSFSMDDAAVKRAGLDYWHRVDLQRHEDWSLFRHYLDQRRVKGAQRTPIVALSRFARRPFTDYEYTGNEILLFGRETTGLPEEIVKELEQEFPDSLLRLPVHKECRSLNLSNTVAIVVYESLRQRGYPGLEMEI